MIWLLKTAISAEFWIGAVLMLLAVIILSRIDVPFVSGWLKALLGSKK